MKPVVDSMRWGEIGFGFNASIVLNYRFLVINNKYVVLKSLSQSNDKVAVKHVWFSGSALVSIIEVILRWSQLVL